MKKILSALCCLVLLLTPCRAAEEKRVALTFDDGPSGRFTRALLEGLAERDTKATFFLCGYRLETYGALAEDMTSAGHEIGIHGYAHKDMSAMSKEQIRQEIEKTAALLPCESVLLRPPGGKASQTVTEVAREMGLSVIQWSVDPRDWAICCPETIEQNVLNCVKDGDIILLHDMSDSSVEAALVLVDRLKAQGYVFCTVSELAASRDTTLSPGVVYHSFP